jgi:GT2 family glycosyltransferase
MVEILRAERNRGFAAGSNIGILRALEDGTEFVWLLNNDTIAPSDSLRKLVAAASDARVGIVGTVLRYMQRPEAIQAWGGGSIARWMGFATHFHGPAALGPDSFLTFASVLLRREMLESVGLLDEGYFMYFEDADFCYRACEAGWRLAVAADTNVLHREGGSAGSAKSARVDRIVTASGLRFLDRYGRPRSLSKAIFVLSRLGKRAIGGNLARMKAVRRGVRDWRCKEPMSFMEER